MARAYLVLARNDITTNLLQVLDLKPTPSKSIPSQGAPQGGYLSAFLLDGVNGVVATKAGAGGGASLDTDGDTYGLSAYLLDNVEDTTGNQSLTAAEANSISTLIEDRVAAGLSLTLANINVAINDPAGVAGSDLDGTLGNSTGSVEEILRILAGERYLLPADSQVRAAGGTFDATRRGYFVTAPNVEVPASVSTTHGIDRQIRGRSHMAPLAYLAPGEPLTVPVQTGTQDVHFRNMQVVLDTGDLHQSAGTGALGALKDATFAFTNPGYSYGAGGSAINIAGDAVPATGVGRALVVYSADGNLI